MSQVMKENITSTGIDDAEALLAVEEFRQAQFHYREVGQVILVVLYGIVFLTGVIGNILILVWMKKGYIRKSSTSTTRTSSLFDPFLVNLCLSDLLVLFSCCPLMMYSKLTSLWFLGSVSCTLLHYVQGVAVTSNTLSMAVLSLVRFLLIRHPVSRENKNFYRKVRHLLLFGIWFVSLSISVPILFVRQEESFSIGDHIFTFCLESWSSDTVKRSYAGVSFSTVYVIPSAVLLFCHLKVAFLIRTYENSVKTTLFTRSTAKERRPAHSVGNHPSDRLKNRQSFNRRGFKVKDGDSDQSDVNLNGAGSFDELPIYHSEPIRRTGKRKESIIMSSSCSCSGGSRGELSKTNCPECSTGKRISPSEITRTTPISTRTSSTFSKPNHHKMVKLASDSKTIREPTSQSFDHRSRRLNMKRKQVSRLIIWTACCFVFCWLPYHLLSVYIDLTASEVALKILPFTLLLGHFHSALNPIVYYMITRTPKVKVETKLIEFRADQIRRSINSSSSSKETERKFYPIRNHHSKNVTDYPLNNMRRVNGGSVSTPTVYNHPHFNSFVYSHNNPSSIDYLKYSLFSASGREIL